VNFSLSEHPLLAHFDHVYQETHTEEKVMSLSKSVLGRIPQFYILVGLLFVAGGLYLGFYFKLAFVYLGFGLINCAFGIAMYAVQLQKRWAQPAVHAAISAGDAPAPAQDIPAAADAISPDSLHEPSAQH
jgi:hypothetical protein